MLLLQGPSESEWRFREGVGLTCGAREEGGGGPAPAQRRAQVGRGALGPEAQLMLELLLLPQRAGGRGRWGDHLKQTVDYSSHHSFPFPVLNLFARKKFPFFGTGSKK